MFKVILKMVIIIIRILHQHLHQGKKWEQGVVELLGEVCTEIFEQKVVQHHQLHQSELNQQHCLHYQPPQEILCYLLPQPLLSTSPGSLPLPHLHLCHHIQLLHLLLTTLVMVLKQEVVQHHQLHQIELNQHHCLHYQPPQEILCYHLPVLCHYFLHHLDHYLNHLDHFPCHIFTFATASSFFICYWQQ